MGMIAGVDVALRLASTVELRVGGAYAQKGSGASEEGFGSFSLQVDYFQLSFGGWPTSACMPAPGEMIRSLDKPERLESSPSGAAHIPRGGVL